MAKFVEIQRDFSGGEISQRMFMRDDLEIHGKSLLTMENFIPTMQGTAVRAPGTRYVYEIEDAAGNPELQARIFPYITPNNNYALVEMLPNDGTTDGDIRIRQDISSAIGTATGPITDPDTPQLGFARFVNNDNFSKGTDGWNVIDEEYIGGGGDTLGWVVRGQSLVGTCRDWKSSSDKQTCTISTVGTVPEDTNQLQIAPVFVYADNFSDVTQSKHTGLISVGTTAGAADIWSYDFSDWDVGDQFSNSLVATVNLTDVLGAPLAAGSEVHLTFTFTAVQENGIPSTPVFVVNQFRILTEKTFDVGSLTLSGVVPYTAAEMKDVHYVQSPYYNSGNASGDFGNELVFTHPNHPPKRLYYFNSVYTFADIPFFYWMTGGTPASDVLDQWTAAGYPATCTSYAGRLVLAGSNTEPLAGSLNGSNSQTVWLTRVGNWNHFTDPTADVTPADSIQFSSTFRSPIQWVHGQSNLLIGSESYEYVSNSDGIYSPGDLGVFLQSTHGSDSIQPAPMGQYVLFAAEQGSRVRAMQYIAESEYWVSPDMTLYHPELFASGIKRMVRLRNPHQICVCVMGNGQLAMLHQDSYAGISGWSRHLLGNNVEDICVLPKEDGTDVLYLLIKRGVLGEERLYLEAMADWTYAEENNWIYNNASVAFFPPAPTNVIDGLEHLDGKIVQVVSNGAYIGSYPVESGSITMLDGTGAPINVSTAVVGMSTTGRIRTMPLIGADPGSKKRYSQLYVRCRGSGRPLINGTRPADRDPQTFMDVVQAPDIIRDYEGELFGWGAAKVIEVRENLPIRTEVVGIFGEVKENTV